MTKVLHGFVYLFLILAGAALWFELQLNSKRALLTDRNRMQEDYLVRIAATVEMKDAEPQDPLELKLDVSPVEAKIVDSPDTENQLEEYPSQLEKQALETFAWKQKEREQLRNVYVLDAEGNPVMDGNQPLKEGPGTEKELLDKLLKACVDQQARLNTTRDALPKLREKLEDLVAQLNKLKPEARQDKVTIVEKDEQIATLEGEKSALQDQMTKIKQQVQELNAEITSLKDEVTTAREEVEIKKEELDKEKQQTAQLKRLLRESMLAGSGGSRTGAGLAITSLPAGDKGKIIEVDNENMFVIVEFTPEAMKQMKGEDLKRAMPTLEFNVRRPGLEGKAGEFVGRVCLRQEIAGKNYAICDILGKWEQEKIQLDDIVFAN